MDVFVFLRLIHHLLQFVTQCLSGVICFICRLSEFLHDFSNLLRYVEYARLNLCNLEYDLLVVISEFVHLFCVLRLDVFEGFFFILCDIAISRIIVCLLLSWHGLESSNLHGEYVLPSEQGIVFLLWTYILRMRVARLDTIIVLRK